MVVRPVAQGVLRVRKILFCRLFQPMPDFLSVRDEQPAVPIQQSQEVFGMDIAVLCQLLQISHRPDYSGSLLSSILPRNRRHS